MNIYTETSGLNEELVRQIKSNYPDSSPDEQYAIYKNKIASMRDEDMYEPVQQSSGIDAIGDVASIANPLAGINNLVGGLFGQEGGFRIPRMKTWLESEDDDGTLETIGKSIANAIPSLLNVAGDVGNLVLQTDEVAEGIATLGVGAYDKIRGKDTAESRATSAVWDEIIKPYASGKGFKEVFAEDPARILSDALTLVSGGAGAASKIPAISKLASVGRTSGSTRIAQFSRNISKYEPYNYTMAQAKKLGGVKLGKEQKLVRSFETGELEKVANKQFRVGDITNPIEVGKYAVEKMKKSGELASGAVSGILDFTQGSNVSGTMNRWIDQGNLSKVKEVFEYMKSNSKLEDVQQVLAERTQSLVRRIQTDARVVYGKRYDEFLGVSDEVGTFNKLEFTEKNSEIRKLDIGRNDKGKITSVTGANIAESDISGQNATAIMQLLESSQKGMKKGESDLFSMLETVRSVRRKFVEKNQDPGSVRLAMEVVGDLQKQMDDKLLQHSPKSLKKFKEMQSQYAESMDIADELMDALGTERSTGSLQAKLLQSVRGTGVSRSKIFDRLEEVTGVDIRVPLNAAELNRVLPTGIQNRMMSGTAIGTLVAGGINPGTLSISLPALAVGFAFASPKVASNYFKLRYGVRLSSSTLKKKGKSLIDAGTKNGLLDKYKTQNNITGKLTQKQKTDFLARMSYLNGLIEDSE